MRKFIVLILVTVIISACLPVSAPEVDTQATINSIVLTAAAQTLAAQPTPTTVPPTNTATPVVASSPTPVTEATSNAPSATSVPNLTTTPATATVGTTNPTFTATATKPASTSGGATLTPTLGILKYGTLPPAVPSAGITIFNKSKAQAYISLQNDVIDHADAVLEYPVKKEVRVQAPLGYYLYVVWVGGRQIVGEFILHDDDDLTITIFKDKVVVE